MKSFSISSGVGGARNLGGEAREDGEGSVAGESGVIGIGNVDSKRDAGGVVPEGDGVAGDEVVGGVGSVSGEGYGEGGMQERGESCCSSSSPPPLNSSTSQICFTAFLVHFAGGEEVVRDGSTRSTDVGAGGTGNGSGAGIIERDSVSAVTVASSLLALMVSVVAKGGNGIA